MMKTRHLSTAALIGALAGISPAAFGQTPPAAPTASAPAAAAPAPATVTLNGPPMTQPLSLPSAPFSVDVGKLGKWYVGGIVSGLAYVQSNATPLSFYDNGNNLVNQNANTGSVDISNAQVFIQKIDGMFQFYAQIGAYSYPALGSTYVPAEKGTNGLYGPVPVVYGKLVLADNFSISAGKLITLIGDEYTWSFENYNIERGLLTNIEPGVGRGVQANYTAGPVSLALQFSDGFYSEHFNWLTAYASWTINPMNTLALVAGGNLGTTGKPNNPFAGTYATPLPQDNGLVANLIYTYSNAPLTITPFVQYTHTAAKPEIGIAKDGSTYGFAVLANYAFTDNFSLSLRGEYLEGDGEKNDGGPNLTFYGSGSKAYSVTVTPTYKYDRYFVRAEGSYVGLSDIDTGFGFGSNFDKTSQFRGMLETGVLF